MKKIIDWIGIENGGQIRIRTVFLSLYTLAFGYMFIKAAFEHILFSAVFGDVFARSSEYHVFYQGESSLFHRFVCENSFLIWAFFSIFCLFPLPLYGLFFINRVIRPLTQWATSQVTGGRSGWKNHLHLYDMGWFFLSYCLGYYWFWLPPSFFRV